MKNENGKTNHGASQIPAWWLEVPAAEKAVIRDVIHSIRGLKSSQSRPVAQAASKWERSLACFIKFRLIGGASQRQRRISFSAEPRHGHSAQRGEGVTIRLTSSPTSGRSQPDVFPSQD